MNDEDFDETDAGKALRIASTDRPSKSKCSVSYKPSAANMFTTFLIKSSSLAGTSTLIKNSFMETRAMDKGTKGKLKEISRRESLSSNNAICKHLTKMATPMRASGKQSITNERTSKLASQSRHAKASAGSQFTFVLSHKAAVFLWLDHKCDPLAQYINLPPH
jgi:hypothetical protein